MSEIKKVPLVSFPSSKVKDKEVENVAKTFRISLDLTRTDEDTCPMFNYKEELSSAKRKEKLSKNGIEKGMHKNGLDPFMDENDDDIRRIAIEMEAKYGVSGAPKKKRKCRKDDYADIGMGYDESDSFIDNTDGYDEMIPQNVTTLHGGFYINCGALEFKTDDEASSNISSSSSSEDSSDDDDDDNVKKKNRKRILSDSDEDDSQKSKKEKAPPVKKLKLANGQQKIKKKFLTPDKLKPKKKRILPPPPSNHLVELVEEAPATVKLTADEETDDNKLNKDKDDPVYKKPMSLDNITDIINSVASGQQNYSSFLINNPMSSYSTPIANAAFDNIMPIATIDLDDNEDDDSASDMSNNMQIDAKDSKVEPMEASEEEVILPENLPHDILSLVNAIKQAAAINIANNTSVFSSQVNDLILSFERKCKCLGKQSRSKIYAYLAAFTKCKKDALVRRAKSLIVQDDDTKLMHNVDSLRKRIEELMPAIRDNYEQMRKHVEMRKMSSEEETKNLRMPKKTFPWTEEIKKWVRDIYSLKRKQLITQGVVKETLDAQLETYFKTDVQILWSDNWISINYLMKVAKNEKKPEKPVNVATSHQNSNNKTTKLQSADGKESIPSLSDNSVAMRTTTAVLHKTNSSEVFIKKVVVVNNDVNHVIMINPESTSAKIVEKVTNSVNKSSEKPLTISAVPIASLLENPNLPQVSITPVSQQVTSHPSAAKGEKPQVECEIVDISTEQQTHKKPVDRMKTISEILKMQQQKKKEAVVRSISPSVVVASSAPPVACQIIDLTSSGSEVKKRPGPKCSKIDPPAGKELIQTAPLAKPSTTIQPALTSSTPTPAPTSSVIVQQQQQQNKSGQQDTAEIQKVMEELKALQQMTYSPSASNSQSIIKSPSTSQQHKPTTTASSVDVSSQQKAVSVIALNKGYTSTTAANVGQKKSSPDARTNSLVPGSGGFTGASGETSFQEAFQRQFMASLQQQTAATSAKSNNNSHDKFASSSSGVHPQNKISTTSNNNYEPNSSGKVKNNSYPAQPQSAYNIMDDMLANFLTEYGYPLTGQKPKQPSQK